MAGCAVHPLGVGEGPHERQVRQAHLAGAVGGQRHAGVRAAQLDVGVGDDGHLHLVVRRGRGTWRSWRRRGPCPPAASPAAGRDHVLLGDAGLEVAVGILLGEDRSAKVEFFTSPSRATIARRRRPAPPGPRRRPGGWRASCFSRAVSRPAACMASANVPAGDRPAAGAADGLRRGELRRRRRRPSGTRPARRPWRPGRRWPGRSGSAASGLP